MTFLQNSLPTDVIINEILRVQAGIETGNRFVDGTAELAKLIQSFSFENGEFKADVDYFLVTLEANTRYRFEADPSLQSNNLDLVLGVYANPFVNPTKIADDDDSGGGLRPAIVFDTGPIRQTYLIVTDNYINLVGGDQNGASASSIDLLSTGNTIIGGDGNENISGGGGNDTIEGGAGDDTISGGGGDDFLFGGPGDDVIDGGDGDDEIYSGTGFDTLTGGLGADTFYVCDLENVTILDLGMEDTVMELPPDSPFCEGMPMEEGDGEPFPFPEAFSAMQFDVATDTMFLNLQFDKFGQFSEPLAFGIPGYTPEVSDFPPEIIFDSGMMEITTFASDGPIATLNAETGELTLNQGFFPSPPEYLFDVRQLASDGMTIGADIVGNGFETALLLPFPVREQHVLNAPNDIDVFSVFLMEGQSYDFSISSLGAAADVRLQLFNTARQSVDTATSAGGGQAATVSFTAAETGFHFVTARAPAADAFFDAYEISFAAPGQTPALTGNRQPLAQPDVFNIAPGQAATFAVLANDSEPDGAALTLFDLDTSGTAGSVQITGNTVRYDPGSAFDDLAPGATATDTFLYAVSDGMDGAGSAQVTVRITRPLPEGEPPVAADDTASVVVGGSVMIDVLANDSDPEGGALAIPMVDTTGLQGTVSQDGGILTYTPGAAFAGLGEGESATETFSYTLLDGQGLSDTAEVTVTINGPTGDCVTGSEADDMFVATVDGPDCFEGLGGNDSVTLPFALADDGLAIEPIEGGFRVVPGDDDGDDAIELLSIETLIFEDGTLVADFSDEAASVLRYYVGGLGRLPDFGGIGFWVGEIQAGRLTLDRFAQAILVSDEFDARFPPGADDEEFLVDVYDNVYGREFDEGGLEFWLDALERGLFERWEMVQVFADAPEAREIYANETDDGVLLLA